MKLLSSILVRSRRGRRSGSTAVEFGLTFPILVLIFAAIAEWGWFFSQQLSMIYAVRDGARVGALTLQANGPEAEATTRVRAALTEMGLNGNAADINASLSGAAPNEVLTVTASLAYDPLISLVPIPAELESTLTMRLEDQD